MTEKISTILLTGAPGVGKTTLVRKIYEQLSNVDCRGFYTEDVRSQGVRIGFDVVTLTGQRAILARENPNDQLRRRKVGKYSVYVNEFEDLVLPLLTTKTKDKQLFVIDEVGKMELLSKKFEAVVTNLIGKTTVLATIPLPSRQTMPVVDSLRTLSNTRLFTITKSNRNQIEQEIMGSIKEMMSTK